MRSRAYWDTVTCNKSLETQDSLLSSQLACLLQKIPFSSKSSQPLHSHTREGHFKCTRRPPGWLQKDRADVLFHTHIASPLYTHTHTHTLSRIIKAAFLTLPNGMQRDPKFAKGEDWMVLHPLSRKPTQFLVILRRGLWRWILPQGMLVFVEECPPPCWPSHDGPN